MWQKPLFSLFAGLLMATSLTGLAVGYLYDWKPQKIVGAVVIAIGIVGAVWLWDEIAMD